MLEHKPSLFQQQVADILIYLLYPLLFWFYKLCHHLHKKKKTNLILLLSCYISQQPVLCCVMGMVNTPRDAACAIVDGREQSVMFLVFSALILCVEAMEFVSWDPVRVTQVIKGRTVKKVNMKYILNPIVVSLTHLVGDNDTSMFCMAFLIRMFL